MQRTIPQHMVVRNEKEKRVIHNFFTCYTQLKVAMMLGLSKIPTAHCG